MRSKRDKALREEDRRRKARSLQRQRHNAFVQAGRRSFRHPRLYRHATAFQSRGDRQNLQGSNGPRRASGHAGACAAGDTGEGVDEADSVLKTSLAFRIVQALRLQSKRGTIQALGKRKNVSLWAAA